MKLKHIVIQEYRFGGLKMLDYFEFIKAFKSSWIRRLMQCRTKWKNLLEAIIKEKVNNLWLKGTTLYPILVNQLTIYFERKFFVVGLK